MQPKHADAKKLAERAQRDRELFEAFLHGYVHGAQDMDSDIVFDGPGDFDSHVTDIFRNEYPETWI